MYVFEEVGGYTSSNNHYSPYVRINKGFESDPKWNYEVEVMDGKSMKECQHSSKTLHPFTAFSHTLNSGYINSPKFPCNKHPHNFISQVASALHNQLLAIA